MILLSDKNLATKEVDPEIQLKVHALNPKDYIPGRVRLNPHILDKLGLQVKDIVEVKGKRITTALIWPGYPQDKNMNIVRIGPLVRENCAVNEGDLVSVKKVVPKQAQVAILQAIKKSYTKNKKILKFIRQKLHGYPALSGDKIVLPITGELTYFQVIETEPKGPVILHKKTKYSISGDPPLYPEY